jgi:tRNA dimethylallyltransferase
MTILSAMPPPSVIALFGPTAIGKTSVAIALAALLRERGEDPVAVSADALQVYQGLAVLTGAATDDEREALEHRLVGVVPVGATFSVAQYSQRAHEEIDALLEEGRRPIVVGGTGLYLRAALADLDLRPAPPPGTRERLAREVQERGPRELHAELARRAPWAARRVDPNDRHRVTRGLELLEAGVLEPPGGESQLWTADTRRPTVLVGLTMRRDALTRRIDARVDEMVAAGAGDEVREAAAAGASPTARKALGFDELLAGDVEAMKRRTRQYARRQLTWMRKLSGVHAVDVTGREPEDVARRVLALL